uniref:Uncharacterized protein n=1 Tax=Nucleocytoviricota sp. TaxID=2809609 RepID=A0A9E8JZF6_9VIRU|nr:hypothetical protein [Nucleocytoviricota sp.]UZT29293.1 hypothetical protein [Nucleocytoviricota sp.]
MKQLNKIRLCLMLNIFLLFFISFFITFFASHSKYFRFGPNSDFIFISASINSYNKYALLLVLITFNNIIKVLVSEIGEPVLVFNVYNPDKKNITEFTKSQLLFYANSMFFISNTRRVFEILINVSQIDIAIYSIIVEQLISICTVYFLVSEKKFDKNLINNHVNNIDYQNEL